MYYIVTNLPQRYENDEFFDVDRQLVAYGILLNSEDVSFKVSIDEFLRKNPAMKAVSVHLSDGSFTSYCEFIKGIESETDIKAQLDFLEVMKEGLTKRLRIKSAEAADVRLEAGALQEVITVVKPSKLLEEHLV